MKHRLLPFATTLALLAPSLAHAASADCTDMEVWDVGMGMCMPLPMAGMPMRMLMVHGNAFGAYISEQGPRGRDALASSNMVMVDLGTSLGDRHYLNLDYMATAELWTVPARGYPELLQIGESQANGQPFVDAQHPHNSPVMGLTLSDTIKLGAGATDHLKIFFAPRGESTDGPVAFMHRATGLVNPDAPLGHHIGQDVGHIASTVIGGSLKLGNTRFEASTFHGAEPEPTHVDLPVGAPDSAAARLIEELTPDHSAMVSMAYIHAPEPHDADVSFELRASASVYDAFHLPGDWTLHNTLIYGVVTRYDHASALSSLLDEFWLHKDRLNAWGRVEVLQRTAAELQVPAVADQNAGRWVAAFTLGYTHTVARIDGAQLGIGGSVTADVLPSVFSAAYGGANPWTGKLFIQLGGMKMWDL
ncbi:MAG: hypothetical protein HY075_14650 [Deltaproteobacteria bacterium]|nr:hypothetical protein [Deltaproteobacteria bacterium]